MNPILNFSYSSAAVLAIAATGLALNAGTAVAQEADDVMDEVVVLAPISVREVGQTNVSGRIELVELRRRVSYADLDLSKHADVIELEARVEAVAKESCERLSAMYPLDTAIDEHRCIKKAMSSAEDQVQAAILLASS